jgi:PhnB protein
MSTKVVPVLNVASIEASLAFYRDTLGFTAGDAIPGEDGKLMHAEATLGDVMLMFGSNPDAPVGGGMSLYLSLPDVGAQYERVRRAGGTITDPLRDQFWGDRTFMVADPDGYQLMFAQTMRPYDPSVPPSEGVLVEVAAV